MNQLYYGDNLEVLREHLSNESVDLIYLDPPFNSKRDYNLLFKSPQGQTSEAQIEAFEDTWHWDEQAEREFGQLLHQPNTDVADMMRALRSFLGENDRMARLTMMANRLLQLRRVLKSTGSLYLHCDPLASHYLKLMLDAVFGKDKFRTEISWKRQSADNEAKQGRQQYGNVRDTILFYTYSNEWTWNWLYTAYDEAYTTKVYDHVEKGTKRRYRLTDLTGAGGASQKPNLHFEFLGITQSWRYSKEMMHALHSEGRIVQTARDSVPAYKRYLDEMPGVGLVNDWGDIQPAEGNEALGYPAQKPLALLERIISASSNPGDVVLDPFCGCGTALDAAQKLKRGWIGIDNTLLAISSIEKRLKDRYGRHVNYHLVGPPKDLEAARNLAARDEDEFRWWAVSLVEAQPFPGKNQGDATGISGIKFFHDLDRRKVRKIIVTVRGGDNIGPTMVQELIATIEREKADIGLFITLMSPTREMITEAATAGFYASRHGTKYPRVQLLTIKGLLAGSQHAAHPDYEPDLNFKKQKGEAKASRGG